ncbi:DUF397 domain-containing protein [Solihabitans fulvus]|uniref:DUF397 domain-containing protein n=1 Tax=Solihabitans fulvus TaxID=1892852 RepID=A0A5B2WPN2_9PSEU|nr:DUF397 domain-containing protein [Solihabitans fulvus]KAA2252369.1 DUF397 domain-containing protein [Solihabitans fulvus]
MTGSPSSRTFTPVGRWTKSSRSNLNASCVELARAGSTTAVRDSKNPTGPILLFDGKLLAHFLAGVKVGRFGL